MSILFVVLKSVLTVLVLVVLASALIYHRERRRERRIYEQIDKAEAAVRKLREEQKQMKP